MKRVSRLAYDVEYGGGPPHGYSGEEYQSIMLGVPGASLGFTLYFHLLPRVHFISKLFVLRFSLEGW